MKKIKRTLLPLLLCVVLLLSAMPVHAAEGSVLSGELLRCDRLLLMRVQLAENTGITNGQVQVSYDETQLELVRAFGSDLWDTQSINKETASLLFASQEARTEGCTLMTLVFRVKVLADSYTASANILLRNDLQTVEETVLTFTAENRVCITGDCPSAVFTDLDLEQWYHGYTDYAIAFGLMNGTGKNTFSPNTAVTRAMIVTTLYRMAGSPQAMTDHGFTDVSGEQWYTEAVAWAGENGITMGLTEDTFGPNVTATREQTATFLYRYVTEYLGQDPAEGADLSQFTDHAAISGYAEETMAWAVAAELFEGFGDGTLRPRESLTRVQLAKLLMALEQDV